MSGAMSGEPPIPPEDERSLRAAEYVLGLLETEDQAAAAEQARLDPAFAALVRDWEARLAPLADAVPAVAPPAGLFDRIAAGLPGAPRVAARQGALARIWSSAGFWRATTGLAAAAAAAFAGIAYLRPPPPALTAVLTSSNAGAVFLAQVQQDGSILIRPTGQVAVAPAKDLELWALPKGATVPVSLGVLPSDGAQVNPRAQDRPDTQLLVSLEPKGGSPSGAPTGPVLYAGKLDPLR